MSLSIAEHIYFIIALNLIVYFKTLRYKYVSDDIATATQPRVIKNYWHGLWMQFRGFKYFNARQAHLISMALHIINCILIYILFGRNNISFLTAILFSVNPINNQVAVWLSGSNYSVSTILTLLMFILPYLAPLFYFTTNCFIIAPILAPLVFIKTPYWWLIFMIPFYAFMVYKLKVKKFFKIRFQQQSNLELSSLHIRKLIPFIKSYGYYFRLCIWPYKFGLYHQFLYYFGVNERGNKEAYTLNGNFWVGLILFSFAIVSFFIIDSPWVFGLVWFTVNIAMWCNYITASQAVSERYIYLPGIGLMFSLSYLLLSIPYIAIKSVLITTLLVYYLTRLYYYIPAYSHEFWFNEYNLMEFKGHHYVWINRGVRRFYARDLTGALANFITAKEFCPDSLKINYNIAIIYMLLGNIPQAKLYMDLASHCTIDGREIFLKQVFEKGRSQIIEIEEKLRRKEKVPVILKNIGLLR